MDIRKIIKEELEKVLNNQETAHKFDQDIIYLSGFILNKKEDKNNKILWVFEHKEKDYILRFYIQKDKKNEEWKAKIFIYWKETSKNFTNAKGKDYEHSFGPFKSYKEMVDELNRLLKNNPLISLESFVDDDNTQFNKDVLEMIQIMLKNKNKIDNVRDNHFTDLKKILNQITKLKLEEDVLKYINNKYPRERDKQTLLLILQKVYLLDFFIKKEKLEDLF